MKKPMAMAGYKLVGQWLGAWTGTRGSGVKTSNGLATERVESRWRGEYRFVIGRCREEEGDAMGRDIMEA
ncbi:hypothetical protein RRF57_004791 [Xylaria bambusicola]|uniref:Uncharacterized protein n=1 Tax=Xylaria bambusicola TaxID=326684 RepID=A0AAN7Z4N0_9PEZI